MHNKSLKYCIANWKMNFTINDVKQFISLLNTEQMHDDSIKTIICPSYTELSYISHALKNTKIDIGAQNVCHEKLGAFTGEISINMLKDIGCSWVLIGHSERRNIFYETNELIKTKLKNVLSSNLCPILCIGETKSERDSGATKDVLESQLSIITNEIIDYKQKLIIAYEPVWAIGTGETATPEIIFNTHGHINEIINKLNQPRNIVSILYGGSVNEKNASIISNIDGVDGFLIGGASLDVNKFYTIYKEL